MFKKYVRKRGMNMNNKRLASMIETQDVYGPPPEDIYDTNESLVNIPAVYGPPSEMKENKVDNLNVFITVILFVLGIIAILNRKISKKIKAIIVLCLIIIGIIIMKILN